MDFNDVGLMTLWVLTLVPVVFLLAFGFFAHGRRQPKAMRWYLGLGLCASVAYGFFAVFLAMAVMPPPDDPYFASGRGLDLRGVVYVIGSWCGGLLGVATTLITFAFSTWVRGRQLRSTSKPPAATAAVPPAE